jgi:hypothetical protein
MFFGKGGPVYRSWRRIQGIDHGREAHLYVFGKVDRWPTFTVFVKVGIHAAGNHGVEYKSRMELESSTQNQNNKLSASVVPTFTKNVKVGHPSVHALVKGWQGYKGAVDKCYDGG